MSKEVKEEVEKLTKIRKDALARIEELKEELDHWETIVKLIEDSLARAGFKKAAEIATAPAAPTAPEEVTYKALLPINTRSGTKLAEMRMTADLIRVVPEKEIEFKSSDPAFHSFFLRKVMTVIDKADKELVKKGILTPDLAFSYEVRQNEAGNIVEIVMKNPRDRVSDIKNKMEWTLRRMYERVTSGK